jgi:hypothetical protein
MKNPEPLEPIIAGVRRSARFSPNHIGNDAAIFDLTARELRKKGCTVHEYPESLLNENDLQEMFILHMARDLRSVRKLQAYEDQGRLVVNSAYGIANCTRENMTRLLMAHNLPHPQSLILRTDTDPRPALRNAGFRNGWVKRGDFHAIHREDVTYVRNREEARSVLREYALRGIQRAVINEHLTGDLLKFYGVRGAGFFHWFYPTDVHHSKFGLEQINGQAQGLPFSPSDLRSLCNRTAEALNIQIYGGDCIVSPAGEIRLIDFNDWPSFAPCRQEAAPYIAEQIYSLIHKRCKRTPPIPL